jgi:hypothetical protein
MTTTGIWEMTRYLPFSETNEKDLSKTLRCDLRAVKYAGLKVSYLGASHIRGAHESMECCRILGPTDSLSRDLRAFSVTAGARKCKAPNNTVPRQIM